MKPIWLVSGGKGGVGKSTISMGLIDFFESEGETVGIIDSDTENPDVWKSYEKSNVQLLNLDTKYGWMDLSDYVEKNPDKNIVINCAARNSQGVTEYGDFLFEAASELKRRLITLWAINLDRDVLESLKQFLDSKPTAEIHVVRNEFFGREEEFEIFNSSKIRGIIESRGGKTLNFPDIARRIIHEVRGSRVSFSEACKTMPISSRIELNRVRNVIKKIVGDIGYEQ